jgi:hypothetical protein
MNTITAALAATAIAAPIAAANTISYIADERILVAAGTTADQAGQTNSETVQQRPSAPYSDWYDAIVGGVPGALGFATSDSTLTDTLIDAVGFASATVYDLPNSLSYASSLGASIHTISFDISQTTTFMLDADLRADGAGETFIRLTNAPLGGGDTLFEFRNTNNMIEFIQHFTLDAGKYTLTFQAQVSNLLSDPPQSQSSARFDAKWTIVPAPATFLLPLAGIALTARRRR